MSELSKADAELVYQYLNDAVRGDVEYNAYSKTLNRWRDERPDDLDTLEDAHADEESSFEWEGVEMQFVNRGRDRGDELAPMTGMEPEDDSDVRNLAYDFGSDYVNAVRDEIRELQERTDYAPRQFVALVLRASNLDEVAAASAMDITVGNYRGKINGNVAEKYQAAQETVRATERLGVSFDDE